MVSTLTLPSPFSFFVISHPIHRLLDFFYLLQQSVHPNWKKIKSSITKPGHQPLFQFLPRPIFSSVSALFQFLFPCFIYPFVFFFHSIAEGALIATMMKGRPNSFLSLIFLLSALHGFLSVHSFLDELKQDEPMRLELIHRYSPQLNGHVLPEEKPKTQLELIKELHRHDVIRHQMISGKRQHHQIQRRNALETASSASVAMPLISGWDSGVGQYLVQVKWELLHRDSC